MSLAVDCSHWGGPLTDSEAECLKVNGYRRVIVNTSGGQARQQASTAKRHGLEVQAYVYLYWSGDVRGQVLRACNEVADLADFMWLDAEDDPLGKAPSTIIFLIHEAVSACSLEAGIYTRRDWWRRYTGRSEEFKSMPLWDAYYDAVPSYAYWTPYGGWEKPAMKQYGGTQEVCGQSVDVNYYEEVRVYTDAEIDAKVGEALALGVRNQTKVDDLANAVNALDGRNGHTLTLKGLWYVAQKAWPFGGA